MPDQILDTLVKLASLGASGISIFAIFWIGWLILRLPQDAGRQRHKTLRFFMLACVCIAIISGATGLINAKFNADAIADLETNIAGLENNITSFADENQKLKIRLAATQGLSESLNAVLISKEAAALEHGSPELRRHVATLRDAVSKLSSTAAGGSGLNN